MPGRHWQAHTRAPGHQDQAHPQRRKHTLRLSSRLPSSRSESPPFGRWLGVPGRSDSGRRRRGCPASEDALAWLADSPPEHRGLYTPIVVQVWPLSAGRAGWRAAGSVGSDSGRPDSPLSIMDFPYQHDPAEPPWSPARRRLSASSSFIEAMTGSSLVIDWVHPATLCRPRYRARSEEAGCL